MNRASEPSYIFNLILLLNIVRPSGQGPFPADPLQLVLWLDDV